MQRKALAALTIGGGLALLLWPRQSSASAAPTSWAGDIMAIASGKPWAALSNYKQYAAVIDSAAKRYGIPADILPALLYRESRYRADIINGTVKSKTGATGIAQFMPATARELGINPLDPVQAINGAARYLSQLHRQFGQWQHAVAAYNWGPGNLARWLRNGGSVPAETRSYVVAVAGVPLTGAA